MVLEGGWHYQRSFRAGKGGFAPFAMWESLREWEGLGFPQPTLCFFCIRHKSVCLHRQKVDLSSTDKCPSLEYAS